MTLFRGQYRVESARHPRQDYAAPGWYFVTICTAQRRCFFGRIAGDGLNPTGMGVEVSRHWREIPKHYLQVRLDEFVVMPNHLHGIVVIEGRHRFSPARESDLDSFKAPVDRHLRPASLGSIVGSFKAGFTAWCRRNAHMDFGWQPRFHDRIIRSNPALAGIREYIRTNPLSWMEDEFYVALETP